MIGVSFLLVCPSVIYDPNNDFSEQGEGKSGSEVSPAAEKQTRGGDEGGGSPFA